MKSDLVMISRRERVEEKAGRCGRRLGWLGSHVEVRRAETGTMSRETELCGSGGRL